MARGAAFGLRTLRVVLIVAGVSAAAAVVAACGARPESTRDARPCADVVLADWTDGRIDGVYETGCYLQAIDALPEDVRAYSSAEDDISRAMQARSSTDDASGDADGSVVARLATPPAEEMERQPVASAASLRQPPTSVLVMTATGLVVLTAGLVAAVARRLRRER